VTPVVYSICGDPGGAAAVAPVLSHLSTDVAVRVHSFGYRQAITQLPARQVAVTPVSEALDVAACTGMLADSSANLLLTGTSMNGVDLEKKFIAAARELGLPSIAVLDFWSNYRSRFSESAGELDCLPDRIAIMDEQARSEMVADGFPADRLVITGQPAFDRLAAFRESTTDESRRAARRAAGVSDDETLVVFVSQPIAEICALRPELTELLGFDECTVLAELVAALERLSVSHGGSIHLLIRPHPRETTGKFGNFRGAGVKVTVSTDGELPALMDSADLVVGMNSVALVEACYLGVPALSYQPGLRQPDSLPTNRAGLSRAVFAADELPAALAELLFDEAHRAAHCARLQSFRPDGGAAARVAQAVKDLFAQSSQPTHHAH